MPYRARRPGESRMVSAPSGTPDHAGMVHVEGYRAGVGKSRRECRKTIPSAKRFRQFAGSGAPLDQHPAGFIVSERSRRTAPALGNTTSSPQGRHPNMSAGFWHLQCFC